jgi:hypothetical protein
MLHRFRKFLLLTSGISNQFRGERPFFRAGAREVLKNLDLPAYELLLQTSVANRLTLDALGDSALLGGDIVSRVALTCSATQGSGDCAKNHRESCCSGADCASLGGFLSGVARPGLARLRVGTLRLCGSLIRGLASLILQLLDWLLQSSGQTRGLVAITDGEVG